LGAGRRACWALSQSCPLGHWFSLMGTFLPFEIITYAI
jgi:hypothetical protein